MLFNLVDNAIKYSGEGNSNLVEIAASEVAQGIRLKVSDQGPGVSEKHLKRIWKPFERGDRTSGGSGLGLSLVRDLTEAMGARVEGRNLPGGGFEVVLDLVGG